MWARQQKSGDADERTKLSQAKVPSQPFLSVKHRRKRHGERLEWQQKNGIAD